MSKRLAIIGSAGTYNTLLCRHIAEGLSPRDYVVLTGGVGGDVDTFAKAFRGQVLNFVSEEWEYVDETGAPIYGTNTGQFSVVAKTERERQRYLIEQSDEVLMIGGGPGAFYEALYALSIGKRLCVYNNTSPWANWLCVWNRTLALPQKLPPVDPMEEETLEIFKKVEPGDIVSFDEWYLSRFRC